MCARISKRVQDPNEHHVQAGDIRFGFEDIGEEENAVANHSSVAEEARENPIDLEQIEGGLQGQGAYL